MKKRNWILAVAIICALSLCVSALPKSDTSCPPTAKCRYKAYVVNDATETHKGDKVSGPVTVVITNINIIRYDVKLGTDVSFTAGPDFSGLGFLPTGAGSQDKAADVKTAHTQNAGLIANAAAANVGVNSIDQQFKQLENDLSQAEGLMATTVNGAIATSTAAVNDASSGVQDLVSSSDSVLGNPSGPATLVARISALNARLAQALRENWPVTAIVSLGNILTRLKSRADNLRGEPGWEAWYKANGAAYELLKARISELQSELKAVDPDSDAAKKFEQAKSKIRQWDNFLASVTEPAFIRTIDVGCDFSFDQTKSNKITLVKRDKLAADPKDLSEEIVTVECTTPFSISAGFGFSSVDEKEFVFVSSKPPTGTTDPINTFGFKNRSSFRTIPLVLINTRLKEWNDTFAVHASAGAGVDIKTGQPSDGTDIEFIVGGSLSFKRSFFVTTGVHVGRVSTLAGGFNLGDTVPSGLSAPPIEKTWKPGFIVAFTYKIK